MEKQLLFCLQAVQLGLVDPRTLVEAGLSWSRGEAADLRTELLQRASLAAENVGLLDQSVELALAARRRAETAPLAARPPVSISAPGALPLPPGQASQAATPQPPASEPGAPLLGDSLAEATLPSKARGQSPLRTEGQVTPESPGRYSFKGELGRGGIGKVLTAFDQHAGREVAVKELLAGDGPGTPNASSTEGSSARFLREARLTAQLEHPSIVPVYEVGRRADGTLYYTMRLVRGRTLADALDAEKQLEGRLRLLPHLADLCAAIAYAHSRGVLHRDLKPHNVMIGEFGETVVLDWGLAKLKGAPEREDRRFERHMEALLQAAAGNTVNGEALGTPEYMPPEQAWGELRRVDEHSDVYSLGAIIYELLTGRPPFSGSNPLATVMDVRAYGEGRKALTPVKALAPGAPPELAAIAEKALAAQPGRRYASARSVLEDLNAYMAGRRVDAYVYSAWELLRRFVSQHKAVASLAAVLALTLLVGTGAVVRAWRSAEAAREAAEANERRGHRYLASAYQEKAERLAIDGDLLGARLFAAAALTESPYNPFGPHHDPEQGGPQASAQLASLQSSLHAAAMGVVRHEATLKATKMAPRALAFSSDGALLASGGYDRTVRIFDLAERRELRALTGHGAAVTGLAFSPDAGMVFSGSADRTLGVWNAATGQRGATLEGHADSLTALSVSADGALAATASADRTVRLWSLIDQKQLAELVSESAAREAAPEALAISADGKVVAVGVDRSVELWDVASRTLEGTLSAGEKPVRAVAFSADGARLLALSDDPALRTFDVATRLLTGTVALNGARPGAFAAFLPDKGRELAAISLGESVEVWNVTAGRRIARFLGHGAAVTALAFAPDGARLASAAGDGRVQVWKLAGEGGSAELSRRTATIAAVASSPDRRFLAAGGADRLVEVWDAEARNLVARLEGHEENVVAVVVADGGSPAAAGARDGTVILWADGGSVRIAAHRGAASALALDPEGKLLASAGADGKVRLWQVPSGAPVRELALSAGAALAVAFSPDGKRLAASSRDKLLAVFDAATGERVTGAPTSEALGALAYSPDGTLLAAGDFGWAVRVFDAKSLQPLRSMEGHRGIVRSVSFSPDGKTLLSAGGSDAQVRLWEAETGAPLQVSRQQEPTRAATFVRGGAAVAIGAGSALLLEPVELGRWKVDPRELLEQAEGEAGMRLEGFGLVPP